MCDLTTRYMGLQLSSPVVAASSPLTGSLTTLRALEDQGVAAVVLPSLYEDVLRRERERYECLCDAGADSCHEVSGAYFPDHTTDFAGADPYLDLLRRAKEALGIPVIASLCGVTHGGWETLARRIADAGADGLELDMSAPALDLEIPGEAVERHLCAVIGAVKGVVNVPVAIKMGQSCTSVGHVGLAFQAAGADALVLFQRLHYPDMDLLRLGWRHERRLPGGSPRDILPPLTWLAELYGRAGASLAATGGIRSADDVVKCVLAGADVVMVATAAMQAGPGVYSGLIGGLNEWLRARGFESVTAPRGLLSRTRLEGAAIPGPGTRKPSPVVSEAQL